MKNLVYLYLLDVGLIFGLLGMVQTANQDTTVEPQTSSFDNGYTESPERKIDVSMRKNISNMTTTQQDDSFTLEFFLEDKRDQDFLDVVYFNVRKAIVVELNRQSSELTTTAVTQTTKTITTTGQKVVVPNEKRRRRQATGGVYKDEDVHVVNVEQPVSGDLLLMPVFLQRDGGNTEPDKLDRALANLKNSKELNTASTLILKRYRRGLPEITPAQQTETVAMINIPFIVVLLFLFLLFIVLLIFVVYIRRRRADISPQKQHLKVDRGAAVAPEDEIRQSQYRPASSSPNGLPKRKELVQLDDNCGWIIPMDDFKRMDNNSVLQRQHSKERTHL